eukprot:1139206-Pelagomonas_calceolata.AAC.2
MSLFHQSLLHGGRSSYSQSTPAPTRQHQHHPPPAAGAVAGAAALGQNTGGAVKRGQAASAD